MTAFFEECIQFLLFQGFEILSCVTFLLIYVSLGLQGARYPDWDKDLPLDILSQVAGGCDELKIMRGVSKTWKEGYENSVTKIRIYEDCPVLPADGSFHAQFSLVTVLHLEYCKVRKPELQNLGGMKRLAFLSLKPPFRLPNPLSSMVGDDDLEPLRRMQLSGLDLSDCCRIGNASMQKLRGMHLEFLGLSHCRNLGNTALKLLRGGPLTKLDLSFCDNLSNEGLASLQGLSRLSDLNLEGWSQLTGEGLRNLGGLPLTKLNLGGCVGLSNGDFIHLKVLPLSKLRLFRCAFLSGVGLAHLQGLQITDLNLQHCVFFDEPDVLGHLSGMPLEYLNLVDSFFSGGVECLFPLLGLPLRKIFLGCIEPTGWNLTDTRLGTLLDAIEVGPGPAEW